LAFEHNRHEIPLAIQTARGLGLDMISVREPFEVSWDVPSIRAARVDGQTEVFNPDCGVGIHHNWNAFPDELAAEAIGREFASRWIDRLPADSVEEPAQASEHTCRWLYSNMTAPVRVMGRRLIRIVDQTYSDRSLLRVCSSRPTRSTLVDSAASLSDCLSGR